MSEFESSEPELTGFGPELSEFERALAGLTPVASRIDRDRLMIDVGRGLEQRERRLYARGLPWALSTAAMLVVSGVLSWQLASTNAKYDALLAASRRGSDEPASVASSPDKNSPDASSSETSSPDAARALAVERLDWIESSQARTGLRRPLSSREIASLTSARPSASDSASGPHRIHPDGPARQTRGERSDLRARDGAAVNKLLDESTSTKSSNNKELGA